MQVCLDVFNASYAPYDFPGSYYSPEEVAVTVSDDSEPSQIPESPPPPPPQSSSEAPAAVEAEEEKEGIDPEPSEPA